MSRMYGEQSTMNTKIRQFKIETFVGGELLVNAAKCQRNIFSFREFVMVIKAHSKPEHNFGNVT